jgi:large subunit ribosomal protein L6
MSRLGKKPVNIPNGVTVSITKGLISLEGPKGKLEYAVPSPIKVEAGDNQVKVSRPSDSKVHMSLHGLVRTLISNMIVGVTEGYKKELEIKGVGYKAQVQGAKLDMSLGFSHPVSYSIPEGVTIETPKPTIIVVKGIDKVKVGEVAAEIRDFYKPEPYKGKGVRYAGEYVRHKAGKTVA